MWLQHRAQAGLGCSWLFVAPGLALCEEGVGMGRRMWSYPAPGFRGTGWDSTAALGAFGDACDGSLETQMSCEKCLSCGRQQDCKARPFPSTKGAPIAPLLPRENVLQPLTDELEPWIGITATEQRESPPSHCFPSSAEQKEEEKLWSRS